MAIFSRFVAIGDSSTEGLMDLDESGRFRGWADRLAQIIADAQSAPLHYANLAVRGLKMAEIRDTQFERALTLRPDLLSIFAGANDAISTLRLDWSLLREQLAGMLGTARARGCTVVTFTMPNPTAINPLAGRWRPRILKLNAVIRDEAERAGALLVDFEHYPIAHDPRLWYDDRLHGNSLGHELVAAALAWRLGVAGASLSWTDPLPEQWVPPRRRERWSSDVGWALHHFGPWLGNGIRGIRTGTGIEAKRPELTLVAKSAPARGAPARGSGEQRLTHELAGTDTGRYREQR